MSNSYDDLEELVFSGSLLTDLTDKKKPQPEQADWGIGLNVLEASWVLFMKPWPEFEPGDRCEICFDNTGNPVVSFVALQPLDLYTFAIAQALIPEGLFPVFGQLTRPSGQVSRTPTVLYLAKRTRPAGFDLKPWEAFHSELKFTLLISKKDVDPFMRGDDFFTKGIILTPGMLDPSPPDTDDLLKPDAGFDCVINRYVNMRRNDKITIMVDGRPFEYLVTDKDIAGTKPITVPVLKTFLLQGSRSGQWSIFFRVTDVVGNLSGGKFPDSEVRSLPVELDTTLLDFPLFYADALESSQIDLDVQSNAKFEIRVSLPYKSKAPKPPNTVVITFEITEKGGASRTVNLPPFTDMNRRGETVPVSNELIKSLEGAVCRIFFKLYSGAGAQIGLSSSLVVRVVGTATRMPPYTSPDLQAGWLPSNRPLKLVTPVYQPHDPDYLETMRGILARSDGTALMIEKPQSAGPQGGERNLTALELAPFDGQGVAFFNYRTQSPSGLVRESVSIPVQIGVVIEELDAPLMQGAIGSNVDPADISGPEVFLLFPTDQTLEGDVLEYNIYGNGQAGSFDKEIYISLAYAGAVLPTVEFPFPRAILDNNLTRTIFISYSIRSGSEIKRSKSLKLSVGTLLDLKSVEILEAGPQQALLKPEDVFNGATARVAFNMRATDQITFYGEGQFGRFKVREAVPANSTTHSVDIRISAADISKGIRPNSNVLKFWYSVTRGQVTHTSPVLDLIMSSIAGQNAPTISGIGDVPFLALPQLAPNATIDIAPWDFITANQVVWLKIVITLDDDTTVTLTLLDGVRVTAAQVTKGISVAAPVDKLLGAKESSIVTILTLVSFAQLPDETTAVEFKRRTHTVQASAPVLSAPAFAGKVGATQTVDALIYEKNAYIKVAYSNQTLNDLIKPQWLLPSGQIADIPDKYGTTAGSVNFAISGKILADSIGKAIPLHYIAVINGVPEYSAVQTLNFLPMKLSDTPQALINGQPATTLLDLNKVGGALTLSVPKWRLSAKKQRVWVRLTSPNVPDLSVLDAYEISDAEALSGIADKPVLRDWFKQLKTRTVTVNLLMAYDGDRDEANATVCRATTYPVKWELGIIEKIVVGSNPHWMAITADGSLAYVTNNGSHTVSVVDILRRKVVDTFRGFKAPFRIVLSPDGSRLYVANRGSKSVSVVNTSTGAITQTLPDLDYIWGLAINATGKLLYVGCSGASKVFVYDAITGARLNAVAVNSAYGVQLNPSQTLLYAGGPTQITTISATGTGGVISTIPGFATASTLAFNPNDKPFPRAYVMSSNAVNIINTESNVIHKSLKGFNAAYSVAMNPVKPECYVTSDSTTLSVIDTTTETVVRRHAGFSNPGGVAVTPDGSMALVAEQAAGTLAFVAL